MDFWTVALTVAFLTGILGWTSSFFFNGVWWWCEWREGNDINWGSDVGYTFVVPFAYVFAIFEIAILYCY